LLSPFHFPNNAAVQVLGRFCYKVARITSMWVCVGSNGTARRVAVST